LHFDNITFGTPGPPLATPMSPAPDPNFPANNVISMFSNVYSNVLVNTWQTPWSQGTLKDIQIQGNDTKKYSALNFVGVETTGPNILNVSAMTHLYLNVWTPNMTEFCVKLVDFGNDLSYAGGDDSELELSFTPLLENWLTLDIPLTDFVHLSSNQHIAQLIFSGNPSGNGIVYIDNVLFHQVVTSVESMEMKDFLIYPNPTRNELYFTNSNEIQFIQIFSMSGKCEIKELNNHQEKLDISSLENGMYLILFFTKDGTAHQQKIVKE